MFISEQTFFRQMINTLKEAGDILEGTGIRLLIEPVNVKVDHAGVFPLDSHDTFFMMQVINSPNIKVLYDIYHQQITEGNLLETIGNNIEHIGHFIDSQGWQRHRTQRCAPCEHLIRAFASVVYILVLRHGEGRKVNTFESRAPAEHL